MANFLFSGIYAHKFNTVIWLDFKSEIITFIFDYSVLQSTFKTALFKRTQCINTMMYILIKTTKHTEIKLTRKGKGQCTHWMWRRLNWIVGFRF